MTIEPITSVALLALLTGMGMYMSAKTTDWTTLFMLPAVILVSYAAIFEATGMGKPLKLEWRDLNKAEVMLIKEPSAIYLWLVVEGHDRPTYYTLPYTENMAKAVQAGQEAQADGERGEITVIIEKDIETQEYVIHADPQRPEPPKPGAAPFNPSGGGGRPGGGGI
jgi:hypothetical protein